MRAVRIRHPNSRFAATATDKCKVTPIGGEARMPLERRGHGACYRRTCGDVRDGIERYRPDIFIGSDLSYRGTVPGSARHECHGTDLDGGRSNRLYRSHARFRVPLEDVISNQEPQKPSVTSPEQGMRATWLDPGQRPR